MISQQLDRLFARFSPRDKVIFISRIVLQPKKSLEEVGDELNLTRERVRQLEKLIKAELESWLAQNAAVGSFSDQVVDHTGFVARFADVLERMPEVLEQISIPMASGLAEQLPAWRVVEALDRSFQCDGNWFYAPSMEEVCRRFDKSFDDVAGDKGFIPSDQVIDAFEGWGSASPEDLVLWAQSRGYKSIRGALVAPRVRAMEDLAAVVLELNGSPMSTTELHQLVASTKSIRSLANQLATHDRVQRVGAESWGLAEWGHERFSSIRDAILARVERLGSAPLTDLIQEMTSKFGVAESSVRVYATSWPLKCEKGVVTLQEEKNTPTGRPFAKSRGSFITSEGFAFRTTVTSEHLRGSGSQFPTALAVALGSIIGESLVFRSSTTGGALRVGWNGNQANISTIRAEIEAIEAQAGDEIAIYFNSSLATFVKLPPPTGDPFEDLGRLSLIPSSERVSRIAVAKSIGLDETAVWDEVLQSVIARKDAEHVRAVEKVIDRLLNPV